MAGRHGSGASRAGAGRADSDGFLLYSRMFSSMEGQQVVAYGAVLDAGGALFGALRGVSLAEKRS